MSRLFNPEAIEREIDEALERSGYAAKRSSLLTLVIVHHRDLQAAVAARLDRLFGRRPLRVIRIETGAPGPSSVNVSARCLPGTANGEVCFQEIVFRNGLDNRALESAAWAPLVIRDLPAVLFWLEDSGGLLKFLEGAGLPLDKVLLDTGLAAAPQPPAVTARRLALLAGIIARPAAPVLGDITWRALIPLRRLAARLFDPPAARPLPERLERVELRGLDPADALCFGLWLAARLDWTGGTFADNALVFAGPGRTKRTVALPGKKEGRLAISFSAGPDGRLEMVETDAKTVRLSSPGSEESADYAAPDCRDCLLAEIDDLSSDPVYYEVLRAAGSLMINP